MSEIPKATHESTMEMFGVTLRCYVLEDGRQVIHADDMHALLSVLIDSEPASDNP